MPVVSRQACAENGKVRFQIISSSLAARHTFPINLETGRTSILSSFKDDKSGNFFGWLPFSE